jgi:hypothetical protein
VHEAGFARCARCALRHSVVWRAALGMLPRSRHCCARNTAADTTRQDAATMLHSHHTPPAGVWTKDIKMRTNLGQPQINKIIKV